MKAYSQAFHVKTSDDLAKILEEKHEDGRYYLEEGIHDLYRTVVIQMPNTLIAGAGVDKTSIRHHARPAFDVRAEGVVIRDLSLVDFRGYVGPEIRATDSNVEIRNVQLVPWFSDDIRCPLPWGCLRDRNA